MGQVFLARDLAFDDRLVALKLLLPEFVHETSDFMQEYALQRLLHHPAIPSVHDFGIGPHAAGEVPYFVMDYVPGVSLARAMQRLKRTSDAWPWMLQVLRALDCLHAQRHLHRDLKPSNILVREDGPADDCAYLIDYGIAIPLGAEPEELFIGTPEYSAPELMAGDPFDVRQDLYAFGLLLYEVVAGHRPWPQEDPNKLWELRTYGKLPTIDNPQCPPKVLSLIDDLLSPTVARRPASAAVVIERLCEAIGLPVEIEPAAAFRMRLASLPFGARKDFERAARDWHAGLRVDIGEGTRPAILAIDNPPGFEGQRLLHELTDRGAVGGARVVRLNLVGRSHGPLESIEPALKVFRRLRERHAEKTGVAAIALRGLAGAATMLTRLHGPTVLTIEGLQRADAMTLELLNSVFTGAANTKLRVVATVDPSETPVAPEAFEALMGKTFAHRTRLPPLTLEGTTDWVDAAIGSGVMPEERLVELHEESLGQPLRLLALLGDDYQRGVIQRTREGYRVLTRAAQALQTELPSDIALEDLLACMMHEYPHDVVETYLDGYEDYLPYLLAEGVLIRQDNGLIGVGGVIDSRRLYRTLDKRLKEALHARLASALLTQAAFAGQPGMAAREILSGPDPIAAVPHLVAAAAESAAASRPREAVTHLQRASRLVEACADSAAPESVWRSRALIKRSALGLARTASNLDAWRLAAGDLLRLGEDGCQLPTMHEVLDVTMDLDAVRSA